METNAIALSDGVGKRLKRLEKEIESFSDVVLRLTGRGVLLGFAGKISAPLADALDMRLIELLVQGTAPLGVTPITTFELFLGVGLATRRDQGEHKVEQFLDQILDFPTGPEAARMAGLVLAGMERGGTPISTLDLLIGCTAVHHGQPVITRNRRDFDRVPGLEVLTY